MHPGSSIVRAASRQLFRSIDRNELAVVARTVDSARRLRLRGAAFAVTRLGNGWLYAILSLVLLATRPGGFARFLLASTVSILLAFVVYPPLKLVLARARPCEYDSSLGGGLDPLDRYSCPSGHSMTAAAYGVSMAYSWDFGVAAAALLCVVIGWSRVATGHHYVTDVLLGLAIGVAVATPVATIVC